MLSKIIAIPSYWSEPEAKIFFPDREIHFTIPKWNQLTKNESTGCSYLWQNISANQKFKDVKNFILNKSTNLKNDLCNFADNEQLLRHCMLSTKRFAYLLMNLNEFEHSSEYIEKVIKYVLVGMLHGIDNTEDIKKLKFSNMSQAQSDQLVEEIISFLNEYKQKRNIVDNYIKQGYSVEAIVVELGNLLDSDYELLFLFADVLDAVFTISRKNLTDDEVTKFSVVARLASIFEFEKLALEINNYIFSIKNPESHKSAKKDIERLHHTDDRQALKELVHERKNDLLLLLLKHFGLSTDSARILPRVKSPESIARKSRKSHDIVGFRLVFKDLSDLKIFFESLCKYLDINSTSMIDEKKYNIKIYEDIDQTDNLKYLKEAHGFNVDAPNMQFNSNKYQSWQITISKKATIKTESGVAVLMPGEYQLRTEKWHDKAELGRASHFLYKKTEHFFKDMICSFEEKFLLWKEHIKDKMIVEVNGENLLVNCNKDKGITFFDLVAYHLAEEKDYYPILQKINGVSISDAESLYKIIKYGDRVEIEEGKAPFVYFLLEKGKHLKTNQILDILINSIGFKQKDDRVFTLGRDIIKYKAEQLEVSEDVIIESIHMVLNLEDKYKDSYKEICYYALGISMIQTHEIDLLVSTYKARSTYMEILRSHKNKP